MKERHTVHSTSTGSAEAEIGPEVEVLNSAMKKQCFLQDTSFKDFENEYGLETGPVFTEKVNLVRVHPTNNIRSLQTQWSSAHSGFSNRDMEGAMRLLGRVMAPGAHRRI